MSLSTKNSIHSSLRESPNSQFHTHSLLPDFYSMAKCSTESVFPCWVPICCFLTNIFEVLKSSPVFSSTIIIMSTDLDQTALYIKVASNLLFPNKRCRTKLVRNKYLLPSPLPEGLLQNSGKAPARMFPKHCRGCWGGLQAALSETHFWKPSSFRLISSSQKYSSLQYTHCKKQARFWKASEVLLLLAFLGGEGRQGKKLY